MEAPNTPPPVEEASPRRNPLIPEDQDKKAALAAFVAVAWLANPQLVLIWITQAEFAAKVTTLTAALKARNKAGALVPQQTGSIEELDELIRVGLKYVKDYISETYGEEKAKNYYAEFGIKTRNDVYELPRAQKERADALDELEAALLTHGLGARTYGTAYWAPIVDAYADLTGKSRKARANISALVGVKNEELDEVEDVLDALISLVDANYRTDDARQAKLRELGFQREYK